MKVKIVFGNEKQCWKLIIDISKNNLSEILVCIEEQYKEVFE